MRKIFDSVKVVRSLDPDAARTTATTGEATVDTKGYHDGMLVAVSGDVTNTTGDSYTVTVMESDTQGSGYTSTGISVTFTAGDDNTVKVARIPDLNTTRKRYLRADLGGTATTYSFIGGAQIALSQPESGPVNDD